MFVLMSRCITSEIVRLPAEVFASRAAVLSFVADRLRTRKDCDVQIRAKNRKGRLDPKLPTILTGCLTRRLPECSCKIGLVAKAERQRNIHQRPIALLQQSFRALKAPGADVAMRRLPHCLLEGPRKMVPAQARDRCDATNRKIAFQVCFYVIQHAEEPASIEARPCETWKRLSG